MLWLASLLLGSVGRVTTPLITGSPYLPEDKYKRRTSTDYLVVHCAQTDASWDGHIDEVRRWHMQEHGWMDVGYNYFIRRNGDIERGRPWWAVGSGVKGWNHNSLHVCLAGGCDVHGNEQCNFTAEQWESLKWFLSYWKGQPSTKNAVIQGHRDFPNVTKYCPSFDVKTWLKENPL